MNLNTKAEAITAARKFRKLFPPGWEMRIWENLGWHIAFRKGYANVSPWKDSRGVRWSCLIAAKLDQVPSGSGYWTRYGQKKPVCHYHPMDAVRAELKSVQAFAKFIATTAADVERLLGELPCPRKPKTKATTTSASSSTAKTKTSRGIRSRPSTKAKRR